MLMLEPGEHTDFWRDTLYGFCRNTWHALLVSCAGDFTAYVTFKEDFAALCDQAGLMLRKDEAHWIKMGIEVSDGMTNLSVVVTQQASSWSTAALPRSTGPQRLRLTPLGSAVVIQAWNPVDRWQLLRVAPFPEGLGMIGQ